MLLAFRLLKLIQTSDFDSHNSNFCHIFSQFLKQYFNLYDGNNREQLMEAYHEDAVMSMSMAYPPNVSAHGDQR